MNEIDRKMNVLCKIAHALNKENVTWVVGASLLLYLKGIVNDFHDIDILVLEEDVPKVKQVFSKFGYLLPFNFNSKYKTKYFLEYIVDNVEIDVIGGYIITNNGIDYDCSLSKDQINDKVVINNELIPLHSLSLWKKYYKLMERSEKVNLLKDY